MTKEMLVIQLENISSIPMRSRMILGRLGSSGWRMGANNSLFNVIKELVLVLLSSMSRMIPIYRKSLNLDKF